MQVAFDELDQRVLRFMERHFLEHGSRPKSLDGKELEEREVKQEFGLDDTMYRRLISRFVSFGLVEVVVPGA